MQKNHFQVDTLPTEDSAYNDLSGLVVSCYVSFGSYRTRRMPTPESFRPTAPLLSSSRPWHAVALVRLVVPDDDLRHAVRIPPHHPDHLVPQSSGVLARRERPRTTDVALFPRAIREAYGVIPRCALRGVEFHHEGVDVAAKHAGGEEVG